MADCSSVFAERNFGPLDGLTLLVGMGGVWLWLFLGELAKRALVPEHDPGYIEALEHAEEHF